MAVWLRRWTQDPVVVCVCVWYSFSIPAFLVCLIPCCCFSMILSFLFYFTTFLTLNCRLMCVHKCVCVCACVLCVFMCVCVCVECACLCECCVMCVMSNEWTNTNKYSPYLLLGKNNNSAVWCLMSYVWEHYSFPLVFPLTQCTAKTPATSNRRARMCTHKRVRAQTHAHTFRYVY